MLLILPCVGESSRFPGTRPKWLLTQPNGNLMICEAIAKFNLTNIKKIVLIALKDQVEGKIDLLKCFKRAGIQKPLEIFLLDRRTGSQPETISSYLSILKEDTPFFVKDCDGQFECVPEPKNEIVTADISLIKGFNVASKSYCKFNENGNITVVVEKQVISKHFCVGGYSFVSSNQFLSSYSEIRHHQNLYVSHVIENMMIHSHLFNNKSCSLYEDWGTLEDWLTYKNTFTTFFIDIDGVLFKNSSEFMSPCWGEAKPLVDNVKYIKELRAAGRTQIVLTTARTMDFSKQTEQQLKAAGIEYDKIVYGLQHSKRIIINDHSNTNPYPACEAHSVQRDEDNLRSLRIARL